MSIHSQCPICGVDILRRDCDIKYGKRIYCSRVCNLEARHRGMVTKRGKENPNYGRKRSAEFREKCRQNNLGEKNPNYNGLSEEHKR